MSRVPDPLDHLWWTDVRPLPGVGSPRTFREGDIPCSQCGTPMDAWRVRRENPLCKPCRNTPSLPCPGCGQPMWQMPDRKNEPLCYPCRRATWRSCRTCGTLMPQSRTGEPLCASCLKSEMDLIRTAGQRACHACGEIKLLADFGGTDSRGHLRGAICRPCQWVTRPKDQRRRTSKTSSRLRRAAYRDTYDGITDALIIERDSRTCLMPRCLNPAGRAIPADAWPHPWSASIDHIIPLSIGGTDRADNKRSSHLRCNISRGAHPD